MNLLSIWRLFTFYGGTPTILLDSYTGDNSKVIIQGNNHSFTVTLTTGDNPGSGGGRLFKINFSSPLSGLATVVFSPGDDSGLFAIQDKIAPCYIANNDQTDFEFWTNGEFPSNTEFKINFIVLPK